MAGIRVELELIDGSFTSRMIHAGETVRQFNHNLGTAATGLRLVEEHGKGFLATMRDVTIVLAGMRAAFYAMQSITTGWVGDLVKVNAEMERLKTLLTGVSTAADAMKEANDQVKYLREFAKNAPFELTALADTFVKLRATGIDPMNGSFKSLVDGVAAFGGKEDVLKRATIAIAQMSGKGVIQMEELRQQLGEAIPRAVELMARSMGVSIGELIKKISTGTVQSKEALEGLSSELERTFGGAAERQMNTFFGMLSRAKTLLQDLALSTGEAGFFDALKEQLRDLNEFLSGATAKALGQGLGQMLTSLVTGLRSAVEWVIKFRHELTSVAMILGGAFLARTAVSALMGFGGAISTVITGVRTLAVAWQAMQTSMAINNVGLLVGQMTAGAQGITRMTWAARGLAAALPMVGLAMTTLSSVALPLGLAIAAVAFTFGMFSNSAEAAARDLERFGATSREQLAQYREHIAAMEREQRQAQERLERMRREPIENPFSRSFRNNSTGAQNALEQEIAERDARIKKARETEARETEAFERNEQKRLIDRKMARIDDEVMIFRRLNDQLGIEDMKAYEERFKALQKDGKDTEQERLGYQEQTRQRAVAFYGQEILVLEKHLEEARQARENGNAEEIAIADRFEQQMMERLHRLRQRQIAEMERARGVTTIAKPDDYEKLAQKSQAFIDKLQASIAGSKAELAGASGEYAKFIYMLEEAAKKKFGPLDNTEVAKSIALMKELFQENEKLQEAVEGQSKFAADAQRLEQELIEKKFELETEGMSKVDKLIHRFNSGMYSGQKPQSRLAQNFIDINTNARKAAEGMQTAFGSVIQTSADRLLSTVEKLSGAWTQFGVNVQNTPSLPGVGAPQGSGGRMASGLYVDRVIGVESGGNPNAAPSNTTARGLGQFIESTWVQFLKEMHPDLIGSLDKQGQLNLRFNEQMMREAIEWYAGKNANALGSKGIEATDANVYLAHFLGPQGAIAALSKTADTMLTAVPELSSAMMKNQAVFKNLQTVGDLKAWAEKKMGSGKSYFPQYANDSRSAIPTGMSGLNAETIARLRELEQIVNAKGADTALGKGVKELMLQVEKVNASGGGAVKHLAEIRKQISEGKFGPDRDPDSDRYKNLIEWANKWDQADAAARERQKMRSQLERVTESRDREEALLANKEAEIQRRLEAEQTFKFSSEYIRKLAQLERDDELLRKAHDAGMIDESELGQQLLRTAALKKAMTDQEVMNTIQGEQVKTREIQRGLMTTDQAREAEFQEEVRRLNALVALTTVGSEQRATAERLAQQKIAALRAQTAQNSPIGKMVKDWQSLTNNLEQAGAQWMNGFTDKLADMVVTGKADFKSLADSILKDLARLAIRGLMAQFLGPLKGGGGAKMGGGGGKGAFHTGGIVGGRAPQTRNVSPLAFFGAPKFHTGGFPGLTKDEVPIIAKKGEEVGWPEQLAKKYGGGGFGQSNVFNVTLNASGGTPTQNQDLATRMSKELKEVAASMVTSELRRQMRPGGMMAGAKR